MEPLGFRFDVTTDDPSSGQSIQGMLDYGARRRVSIPGAAVSNFSTIGPDWFRDDADVVRWLGRDVLESPLVNSLGLGETASGEASGCAGEVDGSHAPAVHERVGPAVGREPARSWSRST